MIHKTRRTSMMLSYVAFGLMVLVVLAALVLVAAGWPYAG